MREPGGREYKLIGRRAEVAAGGRRLETRRAWPPGAAREGEQQKMRVLAIDTTTRWGSVAVVDAERVLGELRFAGALDHSARVLPAAQALLEVLHLPLGEIDAFAVTVGPGSFTGLRVGIATVQGLALAARRPCLGLSTLDVLAARVRGAATALVAAIDAYRDEVYLGVYDAEARPQGPPRVGRPEALSATLPRGAAFVGDGAQRYQDAFAAGCPGASFAQRSLFLAATLGQLAVPRLQAGEGGAAGSLRPLYLRGAPIRTPGP